MNKTEVVGDTFKSVLRQALKEAEKKMRIEWPKQPIVTQYWKKRRSE